MYSLVEHLSRIAWLGRYAPKNIMAMYSSYFDESGHPDDSEHLVVAGCVAEVDQWIHFEREWKAALLPFNTDTFHAVDFNARCRAFKSLKGQDGAARDLLRRLIGIICRRVEKTFSSVASISEFRAMDAKYLFSECYGYPYPSSCRICVASVELWAAKHAINHHHIQHVFESGAKHRGQLEWIMERDGQATPLFQKKSEAVPLQAGDLIAWLQHLALTNNGEVPSMYGEAIEKLGSHPNDWGKSKFEDPDKFPTVFQIPIRDPGLKYQSQLVTKNGFRYTVVRSWPKGSHAGKLVKKTLTLRDPIPFKPEDMHRAIMEYDERTKSHA